MRIFKDFVVVKNPRTDMEELSDFDTLEEAQEYAEGRRDYFRRCDEDAVEWDRKPIGIKVGILQIVEG